MEDGERDYEEIARLAQEKERDEMPEKRRKAHALYCLIDEVDSAGDALKPNKLKGYQNCAEEIRSVAAKRREIIPDIKKDDRYNGSNGDRAAAGLWFILQDIEEALKHVRSETLEGLQLYYEYAMLKCKETSDFVKYRFVQNKDDPTDKGHEEFILKSEEYSD